MSRHNLENYREKVLEGSVIVTLLSLGAGPMVAQLVNVMYSVLNSFWLVLYDQLTVAVPRQVFPVQMLFGALNSLVSTAGAAFVSQYMGAGMYREVKREASRILTASLIIGVSAATFFLALRDYIFTYIVATPPEIRGEVMRYTLVSGFNIILSSISMSLSLVVNSVGETRLPSLINITSVTVNTILDPVFILGIGFVPRFGAMGAALTDTIGLSLSIAGLSTLIKRRIPEAMPSLVLDFPRDWLGKVLRIGGPVTLSMSTNSLAFIIQQRMVNEFGVLVATAYSIGMIVLDLADGIMWGLLGSIAIIVGQSLGAGNIKRAREAAIKGTLFVASIVALGVTVIYPFRLSIISVFTSNPQVQALSMEFLDTILVGLPFFAMFIAGMNIGRGSGSTLIPTVLGMFRLWALRIALSYLLAFLMGMGPQGLWIGIMLSNVVAGLLMLLWVSLGKWARPIIKTHGKTPAEP
jgi:putative MATE family efflux protein